MTPPHIIDRTTTLHRLTGVIDRLADLTTLHGGMSLTWHTATRVPPQLAWWGIGTMLAADPAHVATDVGAILDTVDPRMDGRATLSVDGWCTVRGHVHGVTPTIEYVTRIPLHAAEYLPDVYAAQVARLEAARHDQGVPS